MRALSFAALIALVLDQASKYLVVHSMGLAFRHQIDVLPPLLTFRYGENRGINFGLFEGETEAARWALIGFSLVVVAAVLFWVRRSHPTNLPILIGAGLLIGGAVGNVIDRLAYGYVLDFLNMSCCGIQNPFVFNVADIFIFLGAGALILFESRKPDGKKGS